MKLTKAVVARLALPAGKSDVIYFDDELPGFGIRLRAGGKHSWIVQYRVGPKQRRITFGDVRKLDADKARVEARKKLSQVNLGGDPQADKLTARAKAAVTLGAVVDQYLANKKARLRPKSYSETERYLRKSWRSLHRIQIHRITRGDIAARLAGIANENGPIAGTRARAALSALVSWAMREGHDIQTNPVVGTNRPAKPRSRDRVLSEDELRDIWLACRDDDYGQILKLLMITGQRRDEVGAMAWSEIDFDRGNWLIPGERTKNKRAHSIALPGLALEILRKVERREGIDRVFGRGDRGFGGWSKAKAAIEKRISLDRGAGAGTAGHSAIEGTPMAPWTVHDIRRSVATHMADLGVAPHVIEALLNHLSGNKAGVAGVYNRSGYERETRNALVVWADHLRAMINQSESRVVTLRDRRP